MSSNEPQRSAPKRILIVEDNELNMKLLNDVLEAYGYDVIKTASGAAVLELARQHGPDLILIDIQLPDISGLEAVRQLKGHAQTKAIPVIAVTAFAMALDELACVHGHCRRRVRRLYRQTDYAARVSPDRRRLPWPRAGKRLTRAPSRQRRAGADPANRAAGPQSGTAPDSPEPETGPRSFRRQVV